ncbi:efflux RND transporter periplasmic adaptor subunit [bacterium]|nr:efflux RND transporter periplasmic adaptor subunit [bacterium]
MNKLLIIGLTALLAAGVSGYLFFGARDQAPVIDESQPHDYFTCSMHPQVHKHEPGRCPICNMSLVKISPDVQSEAASTVEGRGAVTLSSQKIQLIGVRFGTAEIAPLNRTIRAYGRAAYDPDLYHTQEEYLSALDLMEMSEDAGLPASRERNVRLLKAAETRLRLLGLNDAQIRILRTRRRVDLGLLLGSAEGGKVWVYADVYESDLSFVRVGIPVDVEAPAYPGRAFKGVIAAIDPVINPKTRTARIRSEVDDPDQLLKPDLYVNVFIRSDLGEGLSVPDGAVLDSGRRQHVFVHKGGGRFEPRLVKIGRKAEGRIEILEGLAAGEEVVTSGNFLIDSESQLRAGISGMTYYGGQEITPGKAGTEGVHRH